MGTMYIKTGRNPMKKIKNVYLSFPMLLLFYILLAGCEKKVDIKLNDEDPKIVVEGSISNDPDFPYPYIILTRSIGFLGKIDLNTLENAFVHDADVHVYDIYNNQIVDSVRLIEINLDTGNNGNKFSFYTIDTADFNAFNFVGQFDHTYKLTILTNGKIFTSYTKVPYPKGLDTVWATELNSPAKEQTPLGRQLFYRYTDPDTLGNNVRYFTRRNNEGYLTPFGSVYDDLIINGSVISTSMPLGIDRGVSNIGFDSLGLAYAGDTVIIKWAAIDRDVYNFYSTYEYSLGSSGNPFSAPINVRTNIKGGALGVWAGYGATFDTVYVK